MDKINKVFHLLDEWRCLPDYQLERRADLYFSLYLTEVLGETRGLAVRPAIVPEFPIKQSNSNRSDKVDYVAANADMSHLILTELKTECRSTSREQFEYLCLGAQKSGTELLADIRAIRKASRAQVKYDALIAATEKLGLTEEDAAGVRPNHTVVLIVPHEEFKYREEALDIFGRANVPFRVVTFNDFRVIVLKHDDPLSVRFARSLANWASKSA